MCVVLDHIRYQRALAFARCEHAEIDRRIEEEEKHISKCPQCAMNIKPLYQQLWPNAKVGVNIYATTNN